MTLPYKVIEKDVNSRLDYFVSWTKFLAANEALGIPEDTIASITWTVASDLTIYSQSNTSKIAFVWLTGGTLGALSVVTCRITSTLGRIEDQSFYLFGVPK